MHALTSPRYSLMEDLNIENTRRRHRVLLACSSVTWPPALRCRIDHTHIIAAGFNDIAGMLEAVSRYRMGGGAGYVDPVAFENVFDIVEGVPQPTFEPVIRVRVPYTVVLTPLYLGRNIVYTYNVLAEARS